MVFTHTFVQYVGQYGKERCSPGEGTTSQLGKARPGAVETQLEPREGLHSGQLPRK